MESVGTRCVALSLPEFTEVRWHKQLINSPRLLLRLPQPCKVKYIGV